MQKAGFLITRLICVLSSHLNISASLILTKYGKCNSPSFLSTHSFHLNLFVYSSYHLSFSLICLSLSLVISSFISSRLSLCLCNSVLAAWSFSFSWLRFSICSLSSERIFSSCCFSELVRPRAFLTRSLSRVESSRSRLLQDTIKYYISCLR